MIVKRVLGAGAGLFLGLASCSLALDWRDEGLPCDGTLCAAGFSCLLTPATERDICVRDASLALRDTCSVDAQCPAGAVCAHGACHTACRGASFAAAACDTGEVCELVGDDPRPVCQAADPCVPGGTCSTAAEQDGVCAPISTSGQRCVHSCRIAWDANTYQDTCGAAQYCQPVGMAGRAHLACLPAAVATPLGAACDDVLATPCAPGQACVAGVCRQHCEVGAAACAPNSLCCPIPLEAGSPTGAWFGVCAADCHDVM